MTYRTAHSTNPVVNAALAARNAISAKEAASLADLLKGRPWESPEYRAKHKADLDRFMRSRYGERNVDGLVKTLKKVGWWKG